MILEQCVWRSSEPVVGQTLAGKLRELGHDVSIGTHNPRDGAVSYEMAAASGEVVVNATAGAASLEALEAAGGDNLAGKLLIDVSNPLDFSQGMPPKLTVCNDDSVGEQIQRAHPDAKVVKALNTVNSDIMVNPSLVPGEHVVFVCGNEQGAKAQVVELLGSFGWPPERIIDLGDITNARGTEMYIAPWIRLMGVLGTPHFNIALEQA
jgi:predicted dinucleotide-binding enzyme